MIKYNTRDLIRRATQLADLENSDFISWNENIMAINEAYQAIYQKAIDRDEKFYLKECIITNPVTHGDRTCYDLPSDFYQLYAVNEVNGNRCIIRATVNDSFALSSYDIINNQLVINGSHGGSILFRYYPVPQSLTYQANDVPVKLNNTLLESNIELKDVYDRYIVYKNTDTHTVNSYNWETEESVEIENLSGTEADVKLIACKNGVMTSYRGEDGLTHSLLHEYGVPDRVGHTLGRMVGLDNDKNVFTCVFGEDRSGNILNGAISIPLADVDTIGLKPNLLKLFGEFERSPNNTETEDNEYTLYLIDNSIIKVTRFKQNLKAPEDITMEITDFTCDLINDVILDEKTEFYTYEEAIASPKFNKRVSEIYGFYNNGSKYALVRGDFNNNKIEITTGSEVVSYGSALGVMKIDDTTGYGLMCKKGVNVVIKSIYPNTEVSYPNNLFINLLAFKLAMSYKAKQGGDANSLMVQYQQAEDLFYDTIARDIYSPVRIQNVY